MSAEDQSARVELRWRDGRVATIEDAIISDDVWHARGTIVVPSTHDELRDFVTFCADWNERARTGDADPDEFRRFDRLLAPGSWVIVKRDGTATPLSEPPVFFLGNEVTWRK